MNTLLKLETLIARSPDPITAEMDGDLVMMNAVSGRYHGLSGVGLRIWQLLEQPRTVAAVIDCLQQEYAVPRDVCEAETLAFAAALEARGLIRRG